jgi:predicted nucleic-acid-binding Zn-ribbon protein
MPDQPQKPLPPFPPKRLDLDRAEKKFAEFWKSPVYCPICKSREWHFGEDIVHLFHLHVLEEERPGAYPSIVVICNTCGYTMLFNAKKLGLDNG